MLLSYWEITCIACDMNPLEILCSFTYSCCLPLLRISVSLNHVNIVTPAMDTGEWSNDVPIENTSVGWSANVIYQLSLKFISFIGAGNY